MRVRMVPVLAAMTVVASGCAGGGEREVTAAPLPPATGSPSPAAASPAAVEVPDEATAATPEGAAAFGRFFYDTIDRSFEKRDASDLIALSAPTCEVCQRYITSIEGMAARDERVEGNDITVKESVAPAGLESAATTATVVYDNSPGRVLDAGGAILFEEPGRNNVVVEVVLSRAAGSWVVQEVLS